jgi:hypothetical protein
MRVCLQKAILTAAFVLLGLNLSYSTQYGNVGPAKEEVDAVAALTRLGVPLQQDTHGVVRWIEATGGEISDDALGYLPSLPGLEWLEIGGGKATPAGMANLRNCSSLKRLYVHDINLSGDALSWLSNLNKLEALALQRTGIDGSVLKSINAPALVVLNLSGNKIVDDDMDQIAKLKGLEVLALADTRVGGAGIAKLEGMNKLNELNLMNCSIQDGDLEYFLSMPNLRIVYAAGCTLGDMAVQGVVARFPMLAIFR